MHCRASVLGILCCMAAPHIMAGESQATAALPDTELLEFLGEWETVEGQWLDPTRLEENMNEADLERSEGYGNE